MDESQAIAAFSALAQPTRLAILRYLVPLGPHGAPAGAIGVAVNATSSRLSFHLSALQAAGLIGSNRVSRTIRYHADYAGIGALVSFLLSDCCGQDSRIAACCGISVWTVSPQGPTPGP